VSPVFDPMRTSVSSNLLRSLSSGGLCFPALSLPARIAPAGVRSYGRSDSSSPPDFRCVDGCIVPGFNALPRCEARPRFGALCSPGAPSPASLAIDWRRGLQGSPSLLPNRAIRHNLGGVRNGWLPSPRHGRGLQHGGQLGHASPRPYPPVQPCGLQLSSLSPGPSHLPSRGRTAFDYLARRASTRVGLQPTRSGDYPAAPARSLRTAGPIGNFSVSSS
jgi:hypothetical protein